MKYLGAAAITVILLIACSEKENPEAAGVRPSDPWVNLGNGHELRQYIFPDGTRCVVHDSPNNGMVVCDWSYAVPVKVER